MIQYTYPSQTPIATRGKILSEEELRTFLFCSELYNFGGSAPYDKCVKIAEDFFNLMNSQSLSSNDLNYKKIYQVKWMLQLLKEHDIPFGEDIYETPEVIKVSSMIADVQNMLDPQVYYPFWPRDVISTRISHTLVQVNTPPMFKSLKNQTLHLVFFEPKRARKDILSDPLIMLKTIALRDFVKRFPKREQVKSHIFSFDHGYETNYTLIEGSSYSAREYVRLENIIKQIEIDSTYAPLSCPNKQCKYISKCQGKQ